MSHQICLAVTLLSIKTHIVRTEGENVTDTDKTNSSHSSLISIDCTLCKVSVASLNCSYNSNYKIKPSFATTSKTCFIFRVLYDHYMFRASQEAIFR
jgi:hypothetical protein